MVADRYLVGHSDAAMDLDRAFGDRPAKRPTCAFSDEMSRACARAASTSAVV